MIIKIIQTLFETGFYLTWMAIKILGLMIAPVLCVILLLLMFLR